MDRYGLIRVGTAVPRTHVGNPSANVANVLALTQLAAEQGCDILLFPELCLTGYTCGDLYAQDTLIRGAASALIQLAEKSAATFPGLLAVGLPLRCEGRLYNVAALLCAGKLLGMVPKQHLPNYSEFYERRWFCPAEGTEPPTCRVDGFGEVPFGIDLLFESLGGALAVGVELCEDLWVPIPPSSRLALSGAMVLLNLSGSNEGIGKADYRRQLVVGQSARCVAAYAYASAGVTESTTDIVLGGHSIIAENGAPLVESQRFSRSERNLVFADVDLERLAADRRRISTYFEPNIELRPIRRIPFDLRAERQPLNLARPNPAHPFVPASSSALAERCEEIFQIQMAGLAKRIEVANPPSLHIGVSGGLDSTLALLVAVKTCDHLGRDRQTIHAVTMPGFGTSDRTKSNATRLMELLGVRSEERDIRRLCLDTFVAMDYTPFGIDPRGKSVEEFMAALAELPPNASDLTFENVQARARTLLLMSWGFVLGTGDLSELALGWCTYNGDHMSMYNPNVSVPKTLVRFLVRWVADHELEGAARQVLHSIADTEISPELLPIGADQKIQSTEDAIGPYELHDYFLYHFLRFGHSPQKILYLASQANFDRDYSESELRTTLRTFLRRFFVYQFKRSCLPDGPKVGTVSLSPRGDWRMPSDADAAAWLAEVEEL